MLWSWKDPASFSLPLLSSMMEKRMEDKIKVKEKKKKKKKLAKVPEGESGFGGDDDDDVDAIRREQKERCNASSNVTTR